MVSCFCCQSMHAAGACRLRRRRGVSLTEILVVIAIIGILIGLLMPSVQSARATARRMQCSSRARQLGVAAHNAHLAHRAFPAGLTAHRSVRPVNYFGNTVFAALLSYVEQTALASRWDATEQLSAAVGNTRDPTSGEASRKAPSAAVISAYLCPADLLAENPVELDWTAPGYSDGWFGITSYVGNGGTYSTYFRDAAMQSDGMFFMTGPLSRPASYQQHLIPNQPPARFADVTDGTSMTLLFGERFHHDPLFDHHLHYGASTKYSRYPIHKWGAWGWTGGGNGTTHVLASTRVPINYRVPANPARDYASVNLRMSAFGSGHPGGANFVFVDGSTRFLSESTNLITLRSMSTRRGNESLDEQW